MTGDQLGKGKIAFSIPGKKMPELMISKHSLCPGIAHEEIKDLGCFRAAIDHVPGAAGEGREPSRRVRVELVAEQRVRHIDHGCAKLSPCRERRERRLAVVGDYGVEMSGRPGQ